MAQDTTDSVFAAICIICFLVGVPSNIVALRFFIRQNRDIPNIIYMSISATDLATSFLVLPVGISIASERKAMTFDSPFVCSVWGFTWELIPYFSVFLVFALSTIRTFALLRPMSFKLLKKKFVWWVIVGYLWFLIGRQLVGVFAGYTHYKYAIFSGYCWNHIDHTNWQYADSFFSWIQFAFPIIPITLSCIISTCVISRSLSTRTSVKTPNHQEDQNLQKMKRKATITIIIVTSVYIVFNIPIFVHYTRYSVQVYVLGWDFLAVDEDEFLKKYAWLITYIVVIALNSVANPIVYMLRMARFRGEILGLWRKGLLCRAKRQPFPTHATDNSNTVSSSRL